MVNQLASTAAATSVTGNATATAQAAQAFMKYSGITTGSEKAKEGDYQPTEEDGKLRVEVAEKMLKWHAEAIGRCVELSVPGDLPKNVFSLMRTLSDGLGRSFVEAALETLVLFVIGISEGSNCKKGPRSNLMVGIPSWTQILVSLGLFAW